MELSYGDTKVLLAGVCLPRTTQKKYHLLLKRPHLLLKRPHGTLTPPAVGPWCRRRLVLSRPYGRGSWALVKPYSVGPGKAVTRWALVKPLPTRKVPQRNVSQMDVLPRNPLARPGHRAMPRRHKNEKQRRHNKNRPHRAFYKRPPAPVVSL